jgi:hypothetical protein
LTIRDKKTTNAKPIPSKHTQGEAKAKEQSKAKRESKRIPKFDIKASAAW